MEDMAIVIQIIADGKNYFCQTQREQQTFFKNNPKIEKKKTESYNIELLFNTADEYLNEPNNLKQFSKEHFEVQKKELII